MITDSKEVSTFMESDQRETSFTPTSNRRRHACMACL